MGGRISDEEEFQTCYRNFRGPFTGAIQYALFDRLHVARVALVLHPKHRPEHMWGI